MKAVVQRVSSASVRVEECEVARIDRGFLVLVGVRRGDGERDAAWLAHKVAGLRVFGDEKGKMNRALTHPEVMGSVLAVSQFTLLGDVRHGFRPSFVESEEPGRAEALFHSFVEALSAQGVSVATGRFGALMQVSLVNEGPVTILLDSGTRGA